MNRKMILKIPRFVPFGANMAQFSVKSDIPVYYNLGSHRARFTTITQLIKFLTKEEIIVKSGNSGKLER